MNLAPKREYMLDILEGLLEPGERLEAAFYGNLEKINRQRNNWYSYIGVTDSCLLIGIMRILDVSACKWVARVPLDIAAVRVRASVVPRQTVIKIRFAGGGTMCLRAYRRVIGSDLGDQDPAIDRFLAVLAAKAARRLL